MSSDHDRQLLASQLQALSLPELVDVLRRVLPAYGDGAGRNGLTYTLVLAQATSSDETVPIAANEGPVTLEMVAWPDYAYYEGGFGPESDLVEQGTCNRCRTELTSTAKQAFCPICGEVCYLT